MRRVPSSAWFTRGEIHATISTTILSFIMVYIRIPAADEIAHELVSNIHGIFDILMMLPVTLTAVVISPNG